MQNPRLCTYCLNVILMHNCAISPANLLYYTCPASKDIISKLLCNYLTHTTRTPGETFLEGSHQSVLWLSLGNFPLLQSTILPPPSTSFLLLLANSMFSICISFGSSVREHLRTIHSSQLSSSVFPHYFNMG